MSKFVPTDLIFTILFSSKGLQVCCSISLIKLGFVILRAKNLRSHFFRSNGPFSCYYFCGRKFLQSYVNGAQKLLWTCKIFGLILLLSLKFFVQTSQLQQNGSRFKSLQKFSCDS